LFKNHVAYHIVPNPARRYDDSSKYTNSQHEN